LYGSPLTAAGYAPDQGHNLILELDDRERRAVAKALAKSKARLIEIAGDTTLPPIKRRSALLEIKAIASILRKLQSRGRCIH
jgi:hypothetical protein